MDIRDDAFRDVRMERNRQVLLALGGDTEAFDRSNSANDWIAYVNAYLGRAARKVYRNDHEQQKFRENMVKAAALCIAAIEAHDKGYFDVEVTDGQGPSTTPCAVAARTNGGCV
jgi:hypothetical protein